MRGLARATSMASSVAISVGVRTVSGAISGFARADMASRPRRSRELGEDPMSFIPRLFADGRGGQPIGLYSHQKARVEILRQAKELVDAALAVGHMHAALRRAHERPSTGAGSPASDSFPSFRSARAWGLRAA